ncbi:MULTISPECIES: DNA repair protein RecO [Methylococcus]|jgi:DNA repair protein RecO (recombination protein O)|uniref:DNA repair protein RecO n=1 Tax=Methylococcus TaxID=413 RepID=UPI001C52FB19|nr:DNA repair protein RecO [Methylococcus capsulatus]QXP90805.1 DNA repair protein RecO [Methylococcus capsulatus]
MPPEAPRRGDPSRVLLDHAYLLHRRDYRETSLLLELFTLRHGRIGVIAKGARRGRQGFAAVLQPFVPLLVSWSGRGELANLNHAEAAGIGVRLQHTALFCGFYLNELLMRLLPPHDLCPGLFGAYRGGLETLAAGEDLETALRSFELSLLEAIGYGLQLRVEAESGEAIRPERLYSYRIDAGPVPAGDEADAVHGMTLLALRDRRFDTSQTRTEAKRLMRRIIAHHLNGRALKSRELFRSSS